MFVGMVYESLIIIFISILLLLILKRYFEKRHKLTFYLFIIFLCFTLAIIFSWLFKVLRLFLDLDYLVNPSAPDPMTIESWFLLRIVNFRFTMIFVTIGILVSYLLKINLFEESNKRYSYFIYGYASFSIIYIILIYIKDFMILDILTFSLVLIYLCLVYVPFMKNCYEAYKSTDEKIYRKGFLSLVIMSICIIGIFVSQIIDRVLMIVLNVIGYTFFYFLGWSFAVVSILFAYLGYIKPKSKEN